MKRFFRWLVQHFRSRETPGGVYDHEEAQRVFDTYDEFVKLASTHGNMPAGICKCFYLCDALHLKDDSFRTLCGKLYIAGYRFNPMPETLPNERIKEFLLWCDGHKRSIADGPNIAFEIEIFKGNILLRDDGEGGPIAIQINGRVVETMPYLPGAPTDKEEALRIAAPAIAGRRILNVVLVPGKLVNIIVE